MNPVAMVFALIAMAMLTPVLVSALQQSVQLQRDRATARQLRSIGDAVVAYLGEHASALQAQLADGGVLQLCLPAPDAPCSDPTTDLGQGWLPTATLGLNPYQQRWSATVTQSADALQALVLSSGGQAIAAVDAATIAASAGADAGVVGGGSGRLAVAGCAAAQACGAYAGWGPIALGGGSPYADPGPGHLALLVGVHPAGLSAKSLQLSALATPLAACSSPGTLQASVDGSGLILDCRHGVWKPLGGDWQHASSVVVGHGAQVAAPDCPASMHPALVLTPQSLPAQAGAGISVAASGSGPWSVSIVDATGQPIMAATALAATYCALVPRP